MRHSTHRGVFIRFFLMVLVFVVYYLIVSKRYGYANGLLLTWLSWSFFVLCTPIADAGMLIDFPIRLISNIKMVYTEISVWVIAISLNLYAFFFNPELYNQTQLLHLLEHIIRNPIPLWLIFIFSAIGTFLSVQLGDELLDVIKHKDAKKSTKHDIKLKVVTMIFVLILVFALYDFLLTKFDFNIPF